MKKILSSMMIAGLLFAGVACGGDDGGSTSSDKTEAPADDSGDSGDTGGSAEVADYCKQAEELGDELAKVMADPTSGDVTALTTQAQELVAAAAALVNTNPDDIDEINACSEKITAAMGG